jgi:hypothetical protein
VGVVQVDVFSFAVVMFELLTGSMISCWAERDDPKFKEVALMNYAAMVPMQPAELSCLVQLVYHSTA